MAGQKENNEQEKLPILELSRRVDFSAAHQLYSQQLSEEENRSLFGMCNNLHGHNFKAEVTLRGPVDPKTGMLINILDLQQWMQEAIVDPFDHKNLTADIDWFKSNVATMENIAVYVWGQMKTRMGDRADLLYEVKVWEMDMHYVSYKGEKYCLKVGFL